ncbi:FISUMP domain-containing protein [Persicobacter diffluens]|uniref:Secretion system C-terminal sorting domain-containing protein n=1 Tax=Persicobacter diffluens TaxID=981 RepID=A0AAN4W5F3_9BACT|nr:hypothetical protein PEDI_49820 [Persicobacter diffluens]
MKRSLLFSLFVLAFSGMALGQNVGDTGELEDIEGNVYEVKLMPDGYWWMTEFLIVRKNAQGEDIDYRMPWNGTEQSQAYVDEGRGLLYNRDVTMQMSKDQPFYALRPQGICPDGWHVPTKEDYIALTTALRGGAAPADGWDETFHWTELVSELGLDNLGGQWNPLKPVGEEPNVDAAQLTWAAVYTSSRFPWGYHEMSDLKVRTDGGAAGFTQDNPERYDNCICRKNKAVSYEVTEMTDALIKVDLSEAFVELTDQIEVWNIEDENDPWKMEAEVFWGMDDQGEDDMTKIEIDGNFPFDDESAIEIRFADTQEALPLGGYDIARTGEEDIPTSVEKVSKLDIYPNPAEDFVSISAEVGSVLTITRLSGELVNKVTIVENGPTKVDVAFLSNGLYLLKLASPSGQLSVCKLIKK